MDGDYNVASTATTHDLSAADQARVQTILAGLPVNPDAPGADGHKLFKKGDSQPVRTAVRAEIARLREDFARTNA